MMGLKSQSVIFSKKWFVSLLFAECILVGCPRSGLSMHKGSGSLPAPSSVFSTFYKTVLTFASRVVHPNSGSRLFLLAQNSDTFLGLNWDDHNVNYYDNQHKTAAIHVIENPKGSVDMLIELQAHFANLNLADRVSGLHWTPLMYAFQRLVAERQNGSGSTGSQMFQYLLSQNINLNGRDALGRSILHHVVEKGSMKDLEILFSRDIKIDLQDQEGTTALMLAAKRSRLDVMDFLFEKNANYKLVDKNNYNVLCYIGRNLDV